MNEQIVYLIEDFIEKHGDKPNLILLPKGTYEFEGTAIKMRYARYNDMFWDCVDPIELDVVICDYIEDIQILKVIKRSFI